MIEIKSLSTHFRMNMDININCDELSANISKGVLVEKEGIDHSRS